MLEGHPDFKPPIDEFKEVKLRNCSMIVFLNTNICTEPASDLVNVAAQSQLHLFYYVTSRLLSLIFALSWSLRPLKNVKIAGFWRRRIAEAQRRGHHQGPSQGRGYQGEDALGRGADGSPHRNHRRQIHTVEFRMLCLGRTGVLYPSCAGLPPCVRDCTLLAACILSMPKLSRLILTSILYKHTHTQSRRRHSLLTRG